MRKFLIYFLTLLLFASCSYESTQNIQGHLLYGGEPISDVRVKLVSGDDYEKCESAKLSDTSDKEGKFTFKRSILRSRIHNYVHLDSLCVYSDGKWVVAWRNTHAPAPSDMIFECNKILEGNWDCAMNGLKSG